MTVFHDRRQLDFAGPSQAPGPSAKNTSRNADITLPQADFLDSNDFAYDIDFGPGGIESQDLDLDLGLDLGLEDDLLAAPPSPGKERGNKKRKTREDPDGEDEDEDMSVELGRDAPDSAARKSARLSSVDSYLQDGKKQDADITLNTDGDRMDLDDGFQPEPFEFGGAGLDSGMDLGGGMDLDGGLDLGLELGEGDGEARGEATGEKSEIL